MRHLGPLLTKKAPWEPRVRSLNQRQVSAPYTPSELDLLWRDMLGKEYLVHGLLGRVAEG